MVASAEIKPEKSIDEKIIEAISEQLEIEPEKLQTCLWLKQDLGCDSLDLQELGIELEEEFDIDKFCDNDIFGQDDVTVGRVVEEVKKRVRV